MVLAVVLFSWMPDMDYGLRSFVALDPRVRWSHSFVFVFSIWGVFAGALTLWQRLAWPGVCLRPFLGLALAAVLSHLFMDWLIGSSWGDPLLWPFDMTQYSSPFGILPSSPKFTMSNSHMYKNLLIETGIIGPVSLLLLTKGKAPILVWGLALLVFVPFVAWGISLPR